eukprot:gene9384-biopygen18212
MGTGQKTVETGGRASFRILCDCTSTRSPYLAEMCDCTSTALTMPTVPCRYVRLHVSFPDYVDRTLQICATARHQAGA